MMMDRDGLGWPVMYSNRNRNRTGTGTGTGSGIGSIYRGARLFVGFKVTAGVMGVELDCGRKSLGSVCESSDRSCLENEMNCLVSLRRLSIFLSKVCFIRQ